MTSPLRPSASLSHRNGWGSVALSASLLEREGTIGRSLTITGLVAAITAPFVPIVTGRVDRRSTLIVLMLLVAAANALTALSTRFMILAVARVLLGVGWAGSGHSRQVLPPDS